MALVSHTVLFIKRTVGLAEQERKGLTEEAKRWATAKFLMLLPYFKYCNNGK